ncbi:receptor-like protein EIX2 [Diospyros lotus]|uniref:receptor-like protein EIX2 n=1 Tax=Diospyros lotus TaxID=55363 RepID=UPI0022507047|nr:receptor-like protein EIX2 [Diospyros lotus]
MLDLGFNTLIGRLPNSLGYLKKLRDLQLWEYMFRGSIPNSIGNLSSLEYLYLLDNEMSGSIPGKILEIFGNLKDLETLDLSHNKLVGEILENMVSLTFLNHLNLSFNNLSGKIPTNNQFQTFGDPSIYEGNLALCGTPLATKCSSSGSGNGEAPSGGGKDDEDVKGLLEKLWLYLTVALGFFMGFWGVCGSLMIKKWWRLAYFYFLDKITDETTILIFVTANRLKRIVDM